MSFLLVAAIDFGTTFSGYAFSFRHEYNRDPLKISTNIWNSGIGQLVSLKTSTCVLFDDDRNFHSFGFQAEEKYSNLALEEKHHKWYYFRRFKMMLYDKKELHRTTKISDDNGKEMEAMTVFSAAILYLKNHLLQSCRNQQADVKDTDIKWVLTVPAIWNDQSKQFMREAAEKAGISAERLVIALEPEAASLYCMKLPVEMDSGNSTFGVFKPGSKYMVVDAGGGTIDITVHEVQENGTLKEIHKANGGDWGGTRVDAAFKSLMTKLMGDDVIDAFIRNNKYDFLELFEEFEIKKRTIEPTNEEKVTFKLPASLLETFDKINTGTSILERISSDSKFKNQMNLIRDKLRVGADLIRALFDESCVKIVDHMQQLFSLPHLKDVTSILLVGGFADSSMLQAAVRKSFNNKRIIIPKDAGLAVLKGAVVYGHQPENIAARICKYTYGVGTTNIFNSAIHPQSKKIQLGGVDRCNDIFSIHVRVDDKVNVGEPQAKNQYTVVSRDQTEMAIEVYTSIVKEPTYTTDFGCTRLGKLTVKMPDTSKGIDRGAFVHMTFSGTEITVTAVDKDDPKKTVSTNVDFLG